MSMKTVILTVSCLFMLALMATPQATPRFQVSHQTYSVPPLQLIDSDGKAVDVRDLLRGDRPFMLNFVFASCTTICPMLTATFAKAQQLLADQHEPLLLVSVSIDPEQDTPQQLKKYASRYKAGANWIFLTGEVDAVETLQKSLDAYRGSKNNHPSVILIRAHDNGPWTRLEGSIPATALVAEFRKARASR